MNHCLPILRGCHDLTARLVPILQSCDELAQHETLEVVAKNVTPRIDDVVQLLDGPMDPRLVEAR